MRNRSSLVLMEQLVMVLVFALAAALCLQVFVRTEEISLETERRDEAVRIAQNAAQLLKAGSDEEKTEIDLSGAGYVVQIQKLPADIPGLEQATITVFYETGELFSLTTGYQEVGQ